MNTVLPEEGMPAADSAPLIRHISLGEHATGEAVIKKSRFLCELIPVTDSQQAAEALSGIKKMHYNATHNCSAMVIGADRSFERYADDGEPQGTAGIPMLEVLKKNDITNILAVVTRYFGGTMLGAGGLARAYGGCVADTLKTAKTLWNIPAQVYQFTVEYADYGKLCQLAEEYGATIKSDFAEVIYAKLMLDKEQGIRFQEQVTHAFMGAQVYEIIGECYLQEKTKQ